MSETTTLAQLAATLRALADTLADAPADTAFTAHLSIRIPDWFDDSPSEDARTRQVDALAAHLGLPAGDAQRDVTAPFPWWEHLTTGRPFGHLSSLEVVTNIRTPQTEMERSS